MKTKIIFIGQQYSPVPLSWILLGEKWGKKKEKGGTGCETSTCIMARDVSEKYQSGTHWPLEY